MNSLVYVFDAQVLDSPGYLPIHGTANMQTFKWTG